MSHSMKPRPAVDLDEFERQLHQAQQAPAGRHDPLAELARIVGQDDPFRSLLANEGPAKTRQPATNAFDDLFTYPDDNAGNGAHLRGSVQDQGQLGSDDRYGSFGPATLAQDDTRGPYAGGYEGASDDYASADASYPVEQRRSRKGIYAVGAVLGVAVVAAGGAFLMFDGKVGALAGGDPPLVKASVEPIKIQPQSPGGVEIPNQNKQIYERAGQEAQTQVVNREEQPIDIRQATRTAALAATDASAGVQGGTTGTSSPSAPQGTSAAMGLGEPRRVRTVSVRPDGSIIGAEPASSAAAPAPALALPKQVQPTTATSAPTAPAKQEVQVASATPSVPVVAARATPSAPTTGAGATSPVNASSTSPQAAPEPTASRPSAPRVANAAPAATTAVAEPAAEAPTGGFAVQLGVRGSESEARAAFQQFQQRYGEALGGHAPMIRKAEVNGNTVFRVRVGPMSRDEATSLCSRIQAAGGQCFTAKN